MVDLMELVLAHSQPGIVEEAVKNGWKWKWK